MVILFSNRNSKTEKEIIEILKSYGGNYISDKEVHISDGRFTIISEYKKTDITLKKGIAVFCDDTHRFDGQLLPQGITGICEDNNKKALETFKKNKIAVISCGMNSKNTVTLSSLENNTVLASLQRTVTCHNGTESEPADLKIHLKKEYLPFSVMASVAVLLLKGIIPTEF